ncbi:SDR family oxidoreductase [Lichenicola sp.]|uniref:SDR family oxidoreductase n=1 Tax=Lichenicola sp. TaxID=2804529 RepID=UPI003AFFC513
MAHHPESHDQATDRIALVTGSAHGIGAAITARLLRDGWIVYGLDREPQPATAPPVQDADRFHPILADVAHASDVQGACARIERERGRLHALVSNAGIMIRKPVESLTLEEWNQVLATNLTSLFLLARFCAPLLRSGAEDNPAGAAIVSIASTRAHMSEPDTESYAATKGGLVALTHALAVSLGPQIRANCISPGWIDVAGEALDPADHAQHPAGRVGVPDDIAGLATWLLGPESGFVTGAEFVSDGGMTRKMIYRA